MIRPFPIIAAIAVCLTLAQCGTAQVTTGTIATPVGSGSPQTVSSSGAAALNAIRARHGLAPVRPDATLARVADAHARDMLANGFFGHTSSNGNTIVERAHAQGYRFCQIAENLARGQSGFDTVLRQWMGSPGHRRNVLHPDVTGFGLTRAPGNLWVLVLGSPGC